MLYHSKRINLKFHAPCRTMVGNVNSHSLKQCREVTDTKYTWHFN